MVLEALTENAAREIPAPGRGDLHADLLAFLRVTFRAGRRPGTVPMLRALKAEAQLDAEFAQLFWERFLRHRRDALAAVLRRHPGQLRVPEDVALDVVFGTLWYRGLLGHAPLGDKLARQLADMLT